MHDSFLISEKTWKPFPLLTLPTSLRNMAVEVANANLCDPAGVVVNILAVTGATIGNSRWIQIRPDKIIPPLIWGVLIERPETDVTWAIAPVFKPLRDRQEQYYRLYKSEINQYQYERGVYRSKMSLERQNYSFLLQDVPIMKRIYHKEPTVKKIIKDSMNNPKGFLVFSENILSLTDILLRNYQKKKCKDNITALDRLNNWSEIQNRQYFNSPYDALPVFISFTGSVYFRQFRQMTQNTFINRIAGSFLVTDPPQQIVRWNSSTINPEVDTRYQAVLNKLIDVDMIRKNLHEKSESAQNKTDTIGCLVPRIVQLSPEALACHKIFAAKEILQKEKISNDKLWNVFERFSEIAFRLALVIHQVRVTEQELDYYPNEKTCSRIEPFVCDEISMNAAIEMTRWFQEETIRICEELKVANRSDSNAKQNMRR